MKLLDGGRKKWELDSRELTDELPSRAATSYTAQEQDHSIRAFRDETVEAIGTQEPRRRAQPRRVRRPAARPGPPAAGAGAARRPHPDRGQRAVEQGGQRRRHLQVRRRAQGRSTPRPASTGSKDTIAYCRIGERSSHTWFVLKELLGQQNVKNYDGSWTEYGSLVGVPVVLGDEPERRTPDVRRDRGRALARRRRRRQGGRRAGPGASATASRCPTPTCGCSTGPVSSPPRCPTSATGHFRFFAGDGDWTLRTLAPRPSRSTARSTRPSARVAEVTVTL